jgi:cell division protein ftsX
MPKNLEKARRDSFFNLYFTSTISIAVSLFMVGLVAFLLLWGNSAAKYTKENIVISLVLSDSTTNDDIQRIESYLKNAEFVLKYKYINKEEALAEYVADIGDNPVELLGYNPIKASFEVNLKAEFINNVFLKSLEKKFSNYTFVENVAYQKVMIADFNANIQKISAVLLLFSILLLAITVILINNTIRISIYSKRFVINTMKLVGAKAWFIRRPFLWRFVKNGLIASFLACFGLFGVGYYIQRMDFSLPLYDYRFFVPIIVVVFAVGFLVSFLAALFCINRYIRMKSGDLYFI